MEDVYKEIEKKIGVTFSKIERLEEACTHRSFLNEHPEYKGNHNERLEFLGDAVLELVVSEFLFSSYPSYDEGMLSSLRSWIVNTQSLARASDRVGLEAYIRMSKGEEKNREQMKDAIKADALEAVLGAIYLDKGYAVIRTVIINLLLKGIDKAITEELYKDPKSVFQERSQDQFHTTPRYDIIEALGPDHEKKFVVGVYVGEKEIARGEGFSKQEAETDAARNGMYVFKKT